MPTLFSVKYPNTGELSNFIQSAGNSLTSFRYFEKRPLEVILNHVCTYLLIEDRVAVTYGHLDKEDGIVWLGIATSEKEKGRGYGKIMMKALIDEAKNQGIKKIRLSVDNVNESAIALYQKFGFILLEKKDKISFYELSVL
ncbi:MAG TPA: GNAT family N-acetyltransferase [Nitrosopumilaceae archaeon]|jgi:ribosomal protein S18 acetylase RimI-like enzyme|nr:GNAT family N-acetyltransferase [Nitrosopumilaceae archaeon]